MALPLDETQALLRPNSVDTDRFERQTSSAKDIVDFDPNGDPEDPTEWPVNFKWGIVALLACMAFTVTVTCTSVVPIANDIGHDLSSGAPSKSASVILVTIWELGEAAGPLLIAPLSEVYGRYPVMNAANTLFTLATILAALSTSLPVFITARALTGLSVATNVLGPAIVGDMFASEQRGSPMSLVMLAPLIGGAVGPAISGAVAETLGWRQVVWIGAGMAAACEVLFLACFRETYKVSILRRRAARLRAESGNVLLRTEFDIPYKDGVAKRRQDTDKPLRDAVLRPAIVLSGSGVLLALSLFGSVVYAYDYVMCVTLPDILQNMYGLSPAAVGSCFMSFSAGSFLSVLVCNAYLDRIYVSLRDARGGAEKPEYRLPLAAIGAFTMPLAVALYGWTAQLALPLPLMLLSVGFLGAALMLAFIPLTAYVVDAFRLYSASAMTGMVVIRCLMGTFLPLTTSPLVDRFGYGWAFTVFAVFSLCLAPIPLLIQRYGWRWRQSSKHTRE